MQEYNAQQIKDSLLRIIQKNERMLDRFQGRIIRSQFIERPNPRLIRTAQEHVRWYSDQLLVLREELRDVERMFGGTVQLREAEESDIRKIWQWSNNIEVRKLLRWPAYSLQKCTEDIHRWKADEDSFPFSIDKLTGEHIGFLILKRLGHPWEERTGCLDFIIIDKNYREYGYGTEAVRAALSFAFDELGVKLLYLWTAADNGGAIRCFEKCSFEVTDVENDITAGNGETYDKYQMTGEKTEQVGKGAEEQGSG